MKTRFLTRGGKRRACLTTARPWRWKWQLNRRVFRVAAFGVTLEVPFTQHYKEEHERIARVPASS